MSDALSTLRTALQPKQGMRRIPFPLESYQHVSKPLSSKRLLNLMAEQAPADARTPAALVPTPGLVLNEIVAAGQPFHAFNSDIIGGYYAVVGTHAYRNTAAGTEDLGVVGTSANPGFDANMQGVTIAVGQMGAVIVVPPNAWATSNTVGAPLTQFTGTFPGASSVAYMDGYFIFTQSDIGTTFYVTTLSDPTLVAALDFANLEGHVNIILRAIVQKNELWIAGRAGWEIWYDSGDADFPFRRRAGGIIQYGVATPLTIAQIDGSVWWVGDESIVYRSVGYQAERVSTHAIEALIEAANPELCTAVAYIQRGHAFYCLTLAGARTVVYDCATKMWHDRASAADGTGPWRPTHAARGTLTQLVGDALGQIYVVDATSAVDNGTDILRQITMPPIFASTNRAFEHRLEVEMEVGTTSNAGITLETSDDGGTTWKPARTMSSGAIGDTRHRVYSTRLGSFRQRVHRLTLKGSPAVYAVDADLSGGTAG